MADPPSLSETLTALMREKGTNPTALAAAIGRNKTAVRDIMIGKSRNPRRDTLEKLAKELDVPVERLISAGVPPDQEQRLVSAFRRLPKDVQERHLALLEEIAAQLERD